MVCTIELYPGVSSCDLGFGWRSAIHMYSICMSPANVYMVAIGRFGVTPLYCILDEERVQ